jgi:4-amino-4-deoxy-L-arabinose transferase-like glycosyltransferase
VAATGRGVWWLAVGAAVGAALLSKYTALFFGVVILLWLILVPTQRRWLRSPWPYLGGALAFLLFAPVVVWNADHQWVSFLKQFGRARIEHMTLRYIGEIIPTQILFATPSIFVLGVMGLHALWKRGQGALAARVLIGLFVWIIVAYFAWHSLHSRVEANWFAPVYPAFAIAAAVAACMVKWEARTQAFVTSSLRWSGPIGVGMFVLLVLQANTGILTGYRRDASVRSVGVGWRELAAQIEAVRAHAGAACVLASDYGTTGWLAFYLPKGTCVAERGERIRWINMPEPSPQQLAGKLLFVDDVNAAHPELQQAFARVELVGQVQRRRGPLVIETYRLDLLEGAKGEALDRSPPPELSPR